MEDVIQSRYIKNQAQEIFFSKKSHKRSHAFALFKFIHGQGTSTQEHLGAYLDEKLNFNSHIREKIGIAIKGIGAGA